ncbi:uncharacterized protein LOC129566663 [Sitodiplosis mosellana]|uniref:uncharacterized protein LOC129566663 n=1 Tax=Sitodiplosis mosellana TaxID=263140 RepID=UPI002443BE9E|nr:uncharacterized protein LOC129566663 [Sitodiplosis mosellana]
MKAVIILVFLCIVYSSGEFVTTLGDCTNYRLVGTSRAYEKAYKNTIRRKTIKFPTGFHRPDFVIRGIRYSDYETVPSNVTIVKGNLGRRRVWIKIRSQPGLAIKVLFEFCGEIILRQEND